MVTAVPAWPAAAETINLSYEFVDAGAVIDAYLGPTHYYWNGMAGDGLLRMATDNPSGPLASKLPPFIWAACCEINQFTDFTWNTYTVQSLDSAFSPGKALLIRQLWANFYDHAAETGTPIYYGGSQGGFTTGEPANNAENINAISLAYALYEIRYDYDGTLASLDPTAGTFRLGANQSPLGPPSILQETQTMLGSLVDPQSYQGKLPDLLALTNPSLQDVIVEVRSDVPEPATMALLALGGLTMLKRRRAA
jgi:hypothetical protein